MREVIARTELKTNMEGLELLIELGEQFREAKENGFHGAARILMRFYIQVIVAAGV